MKVNINEVSARLDMLMDEWRYYIDVRTGEIFEMDQQYLGIAEDLDETDSLDINQSSVELTKRNIKNISSKCKSRILVHDASNMHFKR